MAKTVRECAGNYQMNIGGRRILIVKVPEWVGAAKWHWRDESDCYAYGDPVMTKRDAIADAEIYANNRAANPEGWN